MAAPQVKAFEKDSGKIELFWDKVENAVEYQIFAYSRETGLFRMLDRTGENSFLITSSSEESGFVVQALSYTAFSDNVSPENAVYPVGEEISPVPEVSPSPKKNKILYYGILCLAVLLLLIVVVLLVWNHSRKNKGKPI